MVGLLLHCTELWPVNANVHTNLHGLQMKNTLILSLPPVKTFKLMSVSQRKAFLRMLSDA